jgi:hypothetical protein
MLTTITVYRMSTWHKNTTSERGVFFPQVTQDDILSVSLGARKSTWSNSRFNSTWVSMKSIIKSIWKWKDYQAIISPLLQSMLGFRQAMLHVLFPLDGESFWTRNSTHPVTRPNAFVVLTPCKSEPSTRLHYSWRYTNCEDTVSLPSSAFGLVTGWVLFLGQKDSPSRGKSTWRNPRINSTWVSMKSIIKSIWKWKKIIVNLQPGFIILDAIPTVRILYLCQVLNADYDNRVQDECIVLGDLWKEDTVSSQLV